MIALKHIINGISPICQSNQAHLYPSRAVINNISILQIEMLNIQHHQQIMVLRAKRRDTTGIPVQTESPAVDVEDEGWFMIAVY